MATRTAAAGSHKWSETAAWVEAAVPTEEDDVVFNASSGEIKVEAVSKCRSVEAQAGYASKFKISKSLTVGFSTAKPDNFAWNWKAPANTYEQTLQTVLFASTAAATLKIQSGGITFLKTLYNGASGVTTFQFVDEFKANVGAALVLESGTLDFNNQKIESVVINLGKTELTRVLKMGTSDVRVEEWLTEKTAGLTVEGSNKIIVQEKVAGSTFLGELTFEGGGQTFHEIELNGTLSGLHTKVRRNGFTATKLILKPNISEFGFEFTAGQTYTFTEFERLNPTTLLRILTATAAEHKLNKASGTVAIENARIQNSTAEGATFIAKNSTNVIGNKGWLFPDEEDSAFGPNFFGSFHGPGCY